MYFNSTVDNWTTKAVRNPIASPKIAAVSSGKFVVKDTAGNVDWKKTGLLLQSYMADDATTAFDLTISNDWTETEFEAIFKLVAEVEGRFAVIDTRILLDNSVFTLNQLEGMTFRRQAFEVALYEYTFTGEAGYTATQFAEYALTIELRDKYEDEGRLQPKDFADIYDKAVLKAATITGNVVFTSGENTLIASIPTGITTMTNKEKAGILELANYLAQYAKQPTAELFSFTKVQTSYPGLTSDFKTLFIAKADSYRNYFVDDYDY